jgi:hypothetical protein
MRRQGKEGAVRGSPGASTALGAAAPGRRAATAWVLTSVATCSRTNCLASPVLGLLLRRLQLDAGLQGKGVVRIG